MGKLEIGGIMDLELVFSRLENVPREITESAVTAMAKVAAVKVKASGEAMGIKDPESSVHFLDKITLTKVKHTDSGARQDVTFRGTRTRGEKKTKTKEAEIAFINEFGKRRQPARPFMKVAAEQYEQEITEPGAQILGDWIEKTFEQ